MRRAKKGMAMLSVLFAMAVFMLFGTLITTNALNASVSVKGMVQKTENRNKLGEIGDCFVAEAKKILYLEATHENKCTTIRQARHRKRNVRQCLSQRWKISSPTSVTSTKRR